jgi:hypothetical protein
MSWNKDCISGGTWSRTCGGGAGGGGGAGCGGGKTYDDSSSCSQIIPESSVDNIQLEFFRDATRCLAVCLQTLESTVYLMCNAIV